MSIKLKEIDLAINAGAKEIDVVISREKVLTGKWKSLYDEIVAYREACGTRAKLKIILGVGNLETLTNLPLHLPWQSWPDRTPSRHPPASSQ